MSAPQPTRAELYARIQASSKDAVVLAEMQRLGFWPADNGQPQVAAELIAREAELNQELRALYAESARHGDPETALRHMRRERMAAAREQREATRRQRNEAQYARAQAWHAKREQHMGWLGDGVSAGLQPESADPPAHASAHRTHGKAQDAAQATPHSARRTRQAGRPDRLHQLGLPLLADGPALAAAMGVSVPELRFLATHREVDRNTHYQRFTVPKKTGGQRLISAPMPRLKRAQYWVLDQILAKVPVHAAAHGFLPGHSIVSNAAPHTGQDVVINLDLQDFFPSIGYARIKGVFAHLGYPEATATVLALLCSEARADQLTIDGETVHISGPAKDRVLPQGAPTSPQLTNILCRTLDRRLAALAAQLGFAYTRYADDLSFSASGEAASRVGQLLRRVRFIVRQEGFTPHPSKQAVMRRGRQQSVTGLVVNGEAPSVSRAQRKRLRAALHRAQTQGLSHAHWQGLPVTRAQLIGWAQFVHQVQATQGRPLLNQAVALLPPTASVQTANALAAQAAQPHSRGAHLRFRQAAAQGQAPALASGSWWQPATQPAPTLALTDQQRREQTQARAQARRAAQASAAGVADVAHAAESHGAARGAASSRRSAVHDPRLATAQGAESEQRPLAKQPPKRRFVTYLLQLMAAWGLGTQVLHDRRFTLAAFALLVFLYLIRKQSWALWAAAMGLAWLVAYSLRFLG